MTEPIEVYPFEHEGKQYEIRVFADNINRKMYVYKDGKRIEQAHSILNTHEELHDMAMNNWPAGAEASADLLIGIFKEHFHRYNLDE